MKFLRLFLFSLVVLAGIYVGIERFIDPRGEFRTGVFPRVTMDARVDKMRLFSTYQAEEPVQGLLLGSSRSMKLNPDEFKAGTGLRFFNFAVDSARTEDFLALYRWGKTVGLRPKLVVIGLDMESLHNDNKPDNRLIRNPDLLKALREKITKEPPRLSKIKKKFVDLKNMFAVDYAADAAQSLQLRFFPPTKPDTEFVDNGYIFYHSKDAAIKAGTYDLDGEINKSIAEYSQRYRVMRKLSPKRQGYLESLIDEAQKDGARVEVWLTCLHPRTVTSLTQKTRYASLLADTQQYLQKLQKQKGIVVCDYSRLQLFGGSPNDWYDGAHIAPPNASLICKGLLNQLNNRPKPSVVAVPGHP